MNGKARHPIIAMPITGFIRKLPFLINTLNAVLWNGRIKIPVGYHCSIAGWYYFGGRFGKFFRRSKAKNRTIP
jgi:hypothetical protein